jgi:hypothetical protein
VAIALISIVLLAIAIFLLVGGPGRLASRNVPRPPTTNITVPAPVQAQPAFEIDVPQADPNLPQVPAGPGVFSR